MIDADKLVAYALDPENPVGKHKAAVFGRALGIERDDWSYLHDAIMEGLPHCPVSDQRAPMREDERFTWEVLVPIQGLGQQRNRTLLVITGWEMVEGVPRLVTTRVAPKSRQHAEGGAYNPSR